MPPERNEKGGKWSMGWWGVGGGGIRQGGIDLLPL